MFPSYAMISAETLFSLGKTGSTMLQSISRKKKKKEKKLKMGKILTKI